MDTLIHHLIITPKTARTACGKDIIAFYPQSLSVTTGVVGEQPMAVRLVSKGVTCKECKEKVKEDE